MYLDYLGYIVGVVIIVMGLYFLGVFKIGFLYWEVCVYVDKKLVGFFGVYVIGFVFGFGWIFCVGLILVVILFVVGVKDMVS